MRAFRSIDYWRKVDPTIQKTSILGALFSIVTVLIITYFILHEVKLHLFEGKIERETMIYKEEFIAEENVVNYNLTVYGSPCAVLSLDLQDEVGGHHVNIYIPKKRLSKDGKELPQNHFVNQEYAKIHPVEVGLLLEGLEQEEGCLIAGVFTTHKTPHNFHLSYHGTAHFVQRANQINQGLVSKLNLRHRWNELSFGQKSDQKKIIKRYGEDEEEIFERTISIDYHDLESGKDNQGKRDYSYYVKIVPQFYDNGLVGSGYSLNYQPFPSRDPVHPLLIVFVSYSPVGMKVRFQGKFLTNFLLQLCAITGGIFVIMGLINSFTASIFGTVGRVAKITRPSKIQSN